MTKKTQSKPEAGKPAVARCSKCRWVHEADTTRGTSYLGVELCPLHRAAPDLLEAARAASNEYGEVVRIVRDLIERRVLTEATLPDDFQALVYALGDLTKIGSASKLLPRAIAKAEGR